MKDANNQGWIQTSETDAAPRPVIKKKAEVPIGVDKAAGPDFSAHMTVHEKKLTDIFKVISKVFDPERWADPYLTNQYTQQMMVVFPMAMLLQEAKGREYYNSWEKHGMLFSVIPNLIRKWDRIGNLIEKLKTGEALITDPNVTFVLLTSAFDLYNYFGMYMTRVMKEEPEEWAKFMDFVVNEIESIAPDLTPHAAAIRNGDFNHV